MKISATKIPNGSQELADAIERLKLSGKADRFAKATECCKLCNQNCGLNCEDCYVQTVGDLHDHYRKEIQKRTPTGMYSSGIYRDKDGNYHYAHPSGSD